MVAKDHQSRDFPLSLADVEVRQVVDDENGQEQGKDDDDDGDRDDGIRKARIIQRRQGIGDVDDGKAAEDQGRAAGDGKDRHDEVFLVAAEIPDRGLVAEGKNFPEGNPFEKYLFSGFRGERLKELGGGGFQEFPHDAICHKEDDEDHEDATDETECGIHKVCHLGTEEGRLECRVDGERQGIDADDRSDDKRDDTAYQGEKEVFQFDLGIRHAEGAIAADDVSFLFDHSGHRRGDDKSGDGDEEDGEEKGDDVDFACIDIIEKFLQCRAFHVTAGESAVGYSEKSCKYTLMEKIAGKELK